MKVYKRKYQYILVISIFYVPIVSIISIISLQLNYIYSIIWILGAQGVVLYVMLSQSVKMDSEQIYLVNAGSFSNFHWEDINKVTYINRKVYLNDNNGFQMKIDCYYKQHKELWLEIYYRIEQKCTECKFDDSFIEIIDKIVNEKK